MKKIMIGTLGAVLLFGSLSVAQTVVAKTDKSQRFEKLNNAYETAKAEFVAKQLALMNTEEYKKLRKAKDWDAVRKMMSGLKSPDAEYYLRYETLAKSAEGTPVEVQSLLWMLGHNRDKAKNASTMETLADRDIAGDFWAARLRLIPFYLGTAKGGALLDRLAKDHADKDVRLMARYTHANAIIRDKGSDAEAREAAKADLEDLLSKNPDSIPALNKNASRFVKTRLQIGMKAPDIVAKDVDGNDIKLSDYRGRVVVIDFWGDW